MTDHLRPARPLEVRRHHSAWTVLHGEFELQPNHRFGAWLYEPLDTDAPADAHVNCCLVNQVQFYKPATTEQDWVNYRQAQHHSFGYGDDALVHVGGAWWQATGGRVLRRNEQWVFRHELVRNTRLAHQMNKGPRGDSFMPTLDHLLQHEVEHRGLVLHCGNCRERWFQPTISTFKPFRQCPFCGQEVRPIAEEGKPPVRERVGG